MFSHTRPILETLALRTARRGNSLRQHWRTLKTGRGKIWPDSGVGPVQGYLSSSSRVAVGKTLIQERVNGSLVALRLVPTGFPLVLAPARQIRSARLVTNSRGERRGHKRRGWTRVRLQGRLKARKRRRRQRA
ncbi:hypothetical protein HN011_003291 [Eciton burchellii]|nr:hypothetical protein HN011_003291 [Eciton burchellii]